MPSDGTSGGNESPEFANIIGYVYIFNLIVGTGTLALPKAFQEAGYLLSSLIIVALAFFSYVAFTFVVESMSVANARLSSLAKREQNAEDNQDANSNSDEQRLLDRDSSLSFEIRRRVELGKMALMFLGKRGLYGFYFFLVIYLYGDLAIYSTVVPKSLVNVICTYSLNGTDGFICQNCTLTGSMPCWYGAGPFWTRFHVYRMLVVLFAMLVGPLVFFNVSKTKYLQMFTNVSRWISFLLMLSLTSKILTTGQGAGHPPAFNISKFANLFGISVYAFMCHHSLPSVITPMKSKQALYSWSSSVYCLILVFYITLSLTGSFTFSTVQDVYTLNFLSMNRQSTGFAWIFYTTVDYFLALFPVFTLTTNFPIVGVTLRNNLASLLCSSKEAEEDSAPENVSNDLPENIEDFEKTPTFYRAKLVLWKNKTMLIPIIVVSPPIFISLLTDNVEFLASITGSYAGVGVQYVLPALLACGIKKNFVDLDKSLPKSYKSPFHSIIWAYTLLAWAFVSVIVVSINHGLSGF